MEISVVYPAYNEAASARETIARSLDALRPICTRFEIIIVDDCGRDGTGAIADELAACHPEVRVLHNPRNLGQGASLRIGFREAKYGLVLHNAMDYPFDLRDLDKMIPLVPEADVVVAIRDRRAGYSPYRHLTSAVNVALLNLLFPLQLSDYNFVQLYRKEVLDTVQVDTNSTVFLAPEILIRAHDLGFRIKQVRIAYHPRLHGEATTGNPRVIARSVRDMLRFFVRRKLEHTGLCRREPHRRGV